MDFIIVPLIFALGLNGNNAVAVKTASQAYLQQSGIDRMVDEYQQREVSETVRNRIGQGVFIVRTVTEQRITYRWEFP
jgi:L-fucose isomerase-like protein